ncbi:hypothetical protein LINPERPRIM_LOCUS5064, partial [Linum perenne]
FELWSKLVQTHIYCFWNKSLNTLLLLLSLSPPPPKPTLPTNPPPPLFQIIIKIYRKWKWKTLHQVSFSQLDLLNGNFFPHSYSFLIAPLLFHFSSKSGPFCLLISKSRQVSSSYYYYYYCFSCSNCK